MKGNRGKSLKIVQDRNDDMIETETATETWKIRRLGITETKQIKLEESKDRRRANTWEYTC